MPGVGVFDSFIKHNLSKSESERAFLPWWEDLADRFLYAIVIVGLVCLPFTFPAEALECTIDRDSPKWNGEEPKWVLSRF